MKFSIDAKQFKEAVDRVMAVMKGRQVIYLMECLKFQADDDGVYIYVTNGRYAVRIELNAHVESHGVAYVQLEDIKKVYTMSGYLTIEAGQSFVVRNGKKRSEVAARQSDRDLETLFVGAVEDAQDNGQLFSVQPEMLLSMLRAVDYAKSVDETHNTNREVLMGVNINGNLMKMAALDGYRLHVVKLAVDDADPAKMDGFNKVIYGDAYAHLKKIVKGNCAKHPLYVRDFGKYMKVIGYDFEYSVCYIPGDPLNFEKIIPKNIDFEYTFDVDELSGIVKNYKTNCSHSREDGANAMYIHLVEDKLRTGMMTSGIHTMDELETYEASFGMDGEYFCGFNVTYVHEALAAMKEFCDDKTIRATGTNNYNMITHCNVHPLLLRCGNMSCLVLPVKVKEENISAIRQFMQSDM